MKKAILALVILASACNAVEVHENGLYSTIAGYLGLSKEKPRWREVKLAVPSFSKAVKAKALGRGGKHLVVLLLGLDGRADGSLASTWGKMLQNMGYDVLTFDSTFSVPINKASGHGVPGYLAKDTEAAVAIISAYLAANPYAKVSVVGVSYGGLEALEMSAMQKEGTLPFRLHSVSAYSPPINVGSTVRRLDEWYANDRQDFKLTELAWKMVGHKPVPPDAKAPFSEREMRAGISAVFRATLAEVVYNSNATYRLRLLPRGNEHDGEFVAKDHAATWSFSRFVKDMCAPYWKKPAATILAEASLKSLLARAGPCKVYLTADDPLNAPEDLKGIKDPRVVLVPHGGHVGFSNCKWLKDSLRALD